MEQQVGGKAITYTAPMSAALVILTGVFAVIIVVVLLQTGMPRWERIAGLVLIAAALCGCIIILFSPTQVTVSGQGVTVRSAFLKTRLAEDEIGRIELYPDMAHFPYTVSLRTFGIGLGDFSYGLFRVSSFSRSFLHISGNGPVFLVADKAGHMYTVSISQKFFDDVTAFLAEE